ncbi:Vacuolar membrane protease, partial [Modicella reniformis]
MNSDTNQRFGLDEDDSDSASNTADGSGTRQTYSWSNYSLPQLRELLRQRGQLTTGGKSALKKRLKTLERASRSDAPLQSVTTINILTQHSSQTHEVTTSEAQQRLTPESPEMADGNTKSSAHPVRLSISSRSNSFSAHFTEFINRRRIALETERQEISVYTSPLTVLSYFVLYLLHEFRMLLVWIVSQQYLLVVLPLLTAIVYFVYQTDGAHQPKREYEIANDQKDSPPCTLGGLTTPAARESGLIWYGYWTLLGIASSVGLGTGLHTFILFLGPHIAEVTLAAYKCGNTQFDVRGDHRFVCKSPDSEVLALSLYTIFRAVQWESFFWGFGTALGELPPYFVARA